MEYSRSGKIIKGQEKQIIKSRYEEDVYVNNHTSVWGSYYNSGEWGYSCCHSKVKNSYCVGENGKMESSERKEEIIDRFNPHNINSDDEEEKSQTEKSQSVSDIPKMSEQNNDDPIENQRNTSSASSSDEAETSKTQKKQKKSKKSKKKKQKEKRKEKRKEKKEDKLKVALKAEEEHSKRVQNLMKLDERKRPYNSMYEVKAPTEEELEAYMIKRKREDDPMLNFI